MSDRSRWGGSGCSLAVEEGFLPVEGEDWKSLRALGGVSWMRQDEALTQG